MQAEKKTRDTVEPFGADKEAAGMEARKKKHDAIESLGVARAATSSLTFARAGEVIATGRSQSAATALTIIMRAPDLYPGAKGAGKVAQRAVRDILVVRLRVQAPKEAAPFLEAAAEAFGYPLIVI